MKFLKIIILIFIFNNFTHANSLSLELKTKIDKLFNDAVLQNKIPGAVILISHQNIVLYKKAYGYAQKYNNGILLNKPKVMKENYLFDLASLTKVMATSFGIMILIDDGLINIDDPVSKFFDEFNTTDKKNITIRHLLTHTSGMKQWAPLYYHANNSKEVLKYILKLPLDFKVGEERKYSDLGFMILGFIIEKVSKKRIDEFLNQRLYSKLNLKNTMFNPKGRTDIAATSFGNPYEYKMIADDNFGYKCTENIDDFKNWRKYTLIGEVNDGNAFYANNGIAGHAGLFSNVDDINKLIQVILNDGVFNNIKIIKQETIQKFLTPNGFDQGLAWWMSKKLFAVEFVKDKIIGHTGFTGTYILAVPNKNISIIIFTNVQNMGVKPDGKYNDISDLRREIVNLVLKNLI